MNALILMVVTFTGYIVAYHTYGKFLSKKIFKLDPNRLVPSKEFEDGEDYVPSKKSVVFGHHFTSIAGTGPIVGPAIGVIWGWVPAMCWIFFGSIFMGAVHDFAALVISLRNEGKTIADITGKYINQRVRKMFFVIVFLALLIVIAIFGLVIAIVFARFPQSVIPIWLEIPIALWLGFKVYKRGGDLKKFTIIAKLVMIATVVLGYYYPISLTPLFGIPATGLWTILLLIYAYFASTLPVTTLLQPRDYLNSWQLFIVVGIILLGITVHGLSTSLPIAAPAFNLMPEGAPLIWPFLFITIACGAVSGFHSLVCSGTTSKQISSEKDARVIGYGSMLAEAALATIVIIAVTAGIGIAYESATGDILTGISAWNAHYQSWVASAGMGSKLDAVVIGSSNLMSAIGLPVSVGIVIMGVFIASFAGTTLDSATRIQRYIVTELFAGTALEFMTNKWIATAFAVVSAAFLAFSSGANGKGALLLWPMFGSVNQLLASLALMVATVYLKRKGGLKFLVTALPCIFMTVMTMWAVILNQLLFLKGDNLSLIIINLIILVLAVLIAIEVFIVLLRNKKETLTDNKEKVIGAFT